MAAGQGDPPPHRRRRRLPRRPSILRLVGALLADQHDELAVARRYMSAGSIAEALTDLVDERVGRSWCDGITLDLVAALAVERMGL